MRFGIVCIALVMAGCAASNEEPPPSDPTKPPGYVPPSPPSTAPKTTNQTTMTSEIVNQDGSHAFRGSAEEVFAATQGALRTLGYAIAFADPKGGIIKTEPKHTLATQTEHGSVGGGFGGFGRSYDGRSSTTTYSHGYAVTLTDSADGVRVRAAPRIFINGEDASGLQVWDLTVERGRWAKLFQEIQSNLRPQ